MINKIIDWALNSRVVVLSMALVLAGVGWYAFQNINVEAYPDPAPAIIEVVAQWPGASAEEMERQVTIPLEVTLAGMPGLKSTYSKSLFGLSHLRNVFEYGFPYDKARQEVINRLQFVTNIPSGVQPLISPASPIGEIFRYTLKTPKNKLGQEIYTLNDIKALQDWLIEREFRRVPRIIDVTSSGGTVKRYEIQPDPERLKRFGITLQLVQNALANSNANVGGDFLIQGRTVKMVRSLGFIGGGKDPMEKAFAMKTPEEAAAFLRAEEQRRLREIRKITITAVNNVPIRIDDIVQGGPLLHQGAPSRQGVVVSFQTRLGRVSQDRALDPEGNNWRRQDEKIQGIVLMRKGEESLPSIEGVKVKVEELNQPGRLLPGVELEPYYDREDLVHLTTHTVRHNLIMGIGLVIVILFMFLSNVRTAIIVALNIPLALLFAFGVLFSRGKSANLLSIGAVDFGIIVDSAVIMAENIYRHLASGEHADLPLKERILRSTREIDRALFYSTAIMVCAFIPLFTMHGAEGELFGPMAQTYAFALGGALLLALTLTPVLCLFFFKNIKQSPDNFLVRFLKTRYLWQLKVCLNFPRVTVAVMGTLIVVTIAWPMLQLGREFMPELEEGNLWIRGIFPVHVSLDAVKDPVLKARQIMSTERMPDAVLTKLEALKDKTFENRTSFVAELSKLLNKDERQHFQNRIADRAAQARYKITDQTIAALEADQAPRALVAKLAPLKGKEFAGQEVFWKELGRIFKPDVVKAMNEKDEAALKTLKRFQNGVLDHSRGAAFFQLTDRGWTELRAEGYPEVAAIVAQIGRPDDGTDPALFNNVEFFVPLRPEDDWPVVYRPNGQHKRRTRREIITDMSKELAQKLPGIEWAFSQYIRDNVMEAISGVKGDNSVKIYGPDLDRLEALADKTKIELSKIRGLHDLGIYRIMGQSNLEFAVDKDKCKRWGVQVADVNNVINSAVHGAAMTQMIEGEKLFDVTLRWPFVRRQDQASILEIPVDIFNNQLTPSMASTTPQTWSAGPSTGPSPITGNPNPALGGSTNVASYTALQPRLRLIDLVSPVGPDGRPDPNGSFTRPGGSIITREQGKRFIAVKFSVREDRDLASAVAEVQEKVQEIIQPPYQVKMGGEFEQMEDGERRLMFYIPASLILVFMLLYIAFGSLLDAVVVLSNVFDLAIGGIWALYLTGINFSMSAAVGFVSLFGVAIMDGLLLISYFNHLRSQGLPLREAILQGAEKRVRPVMMTTLTAILGLLPAAVSMRIGAQSQRPLAVVVVGGMITTLFLTRYLMPVLYSFYGHREPPATGGGLAH
jgi:Cu/Ag efflux pump CusA